MSELAEIAALRSVTATAEGITHSQARVLALIFPQTKHFVEYLSL
ncbi:hypothetical protein NYE44_17625 [Paenibacillus sp. FSL L8-0493]|nr:hypothetical protein [Paenibacillus odorifer]